MSAGPDDFISRIPAEDFVTLEDGFVTYWPAANRGAYSAHALIQIAAEIERRNAPRQAQIDAYFKGQTNGD